MTPRMHSRVSQVFERLREMGSRSPEGAVVNSQGASAPGIASPGGRKSSSSPNGATEPGSRIDVFPPLGLLWIRAQDTQGNRLPHPRRIQRPSNSDRLLTPKCWKITLVYWLTVNLLSLSRAAICLSPS